MTHTPPATIRPSRAMRRGTRAALAVLSAALCLTLAAAGCEEEQGGVTPVLPDPGTGTGTLGVTLTLSADAAFPSAERPEDLDTWFEARVTRYDRPVLDATVVLATASGDKPLAAGEDGVYRGSHAGYHRVYGLHVEAGPDVVDATIVGPALHVLTVPEVPLTGGTLPVEGPLEVRWQAEDPAEAVLVRVGAYVADELPDTGAHTLAADAVRGDPGTEVRVEVRRELRMGLAGGTAGSEVVARVSNHTANARLCPGDGCP